MKATAGLRYNLRLFLCATALFGSLVACAPQVTQTPEQAAQLSDRPLPKNIRVERDTVTLGGQNFGPQQGGSLSLSATRTNQNPKWITAADIVEWSETRIVFKVPAGTMRGKYFLFIQNAKGKSFGPIDLELNFH